MRRPAFLAVALAAAVLGSPAATPAQTSTSVRVGATGNDAAAEVYYADELGIFKKHNLTVQILTQRNGAAQAAAVASGSLDIGGQNKILMAHAHERGLPFVYLFPAAQYVDAAASTAMIVAKSSPLRSAKDLEGKTIAVSSLNDLTQTAAQAWIDKNGGDSSKVKFIEMSPSESPSAVTRGTVQAAVIPEPGLSRASAETRVFAKVYGAIAPEFMINGWFATRDWVAKNPAAAKAFAESIAEAARWANGHRAESAKILEKHSRIEATVIEHMTRATYATKFDPKTMQQTLEVAVNYKALPKAFPVAEIYDASL